ncbi:MAG: restriction endonuclease subunit S, partial [Candidatus Omnitrophica bacterium]|nr:restriction endonuclease subunit S [Candidatus Omnitrophota bacterium]
SWQIKKLGDKEYFQILESGIDKFEGEKFYLSTSSIEGNKIVVVESAITYYKRPSRANMQPRLNSVWFARMMNTVKVYSFTEENKDEVDRYILSTGFAGILCNTQKVLPKYLEKIFLSSWFNRIKDSLASDKAIQKSLNNEDIENLFIPIPPLEIQKKIVSILDTIQKAVEIQDRIIEKTKELKKSLMADLFKYGGPSFRKGRKLKKTEIGEIPEDWEVVRLGEIYGIRKKPKEIDIFNYSQIPFVKMEDIGIYDNKINWELRTPNKINTNVYFEKGDLLLAKITPCLENGKQAIANNLPLNFGFATTEIIPLYSKGNGIITYLHYYLQLKSIRNCLKEFMEGTTGRKRLPPTILLDLKILLPSLPEQQEIADILSTIDQKIEIEEKKKRLYEELFKTVLNKIMNQEIDVEDIEI